MQRHRLMNRLLGTAACWCSREYSACSREHLHAPRINPRCRPSTCSRSPASSCSSRCACRGPAPQPLSFTIDNPARISFDLPNTTLALPSRRIDVHSSGLDTILAAETKDRTRLVLNLDKLVPYDTRVDGNNIIVMLGAPAPAAAAALPAGAQRPRPAASSAPARELRAIDFRRSADGAGRVIVKLSDPAHPHQPAPGRQPDRRRLQRRRPCRRT